MGDVLMEEKDLERIGHYVKSHMEDWMRESHLLPYSGLTLMERQERDINLAERIVRVEEGIKHQGEMLEQILHQMDKRFTEMQIQMDKRFTEMQIQMDKRFEQVDKRFEQVDKRFEQVDKRFEDMNHRFNQMFAYFTTGFIILGAMMSVYQFIG